MSSLSLEEVLVMAKRIEWLPLSGLYDTRIFFGSLKIKRKTYIHFDLFEKSNGDYYLTIKDSEQIIDTREKDEAKQIYDVARGEKKHDLIMSMYDRVDTRRKKRELANLKSHVLGVKGNE